MRTILLGGAAFSLLTVSAFGADLGTAPPVNPSPVPPPPFAWTSCYAGGHVGGSWASADMTDPAQLVQDSFLGAGSTTDITTATTTPTGFIGGGQIGCDYQFTSAWVVGIEGAVSGSTMTGSTTVPLPLGDPGDSALVTTKTDFIPSVTARIGYAIDRVLLYAKGGVAWAGDKYDVTGVFQGAGFGFEGLDTRTGWTAGGGIEWAFSGIWSVSAEYDFYQFETGTVSLSDSINALSGPVSTKQSVQVVKVGLNFHLWSSNN